VFLTGYKRVGVYRLISKLISVQRSDYIDIQHAFAALKFIHDGDKFAVLLIFIVANDIAKCLFVCFILLL